MQIMFDSDFEQSSMKLQCGCMINDTSGEIIDECIPHKDAHFMR